MILLSHPTAEGAVRHVARALSRAGVLGEFWTCAHESSVPHPFLVASAALAGADQGNLDDLEISMAWRMAAAGVRAAPAGMRRRRLDTMCRSLDHTVSNRLACEHFKGVYAYEDSAEESFRIAGLRGLLRIYDLATGHWQAERDILAEEAALEPDWAATLAAPAAIPRDIERKESELQQADLVIVPSTFALRTLENIASLPATIAMLLPSATTPPDTVVRVARQQSTGQLRALFVGDLNQRKGLSYLFRACRELRGAVSLTVIGGPPVISCRALERELGEVRSLAGCSTSDIRAEMEAHDVLVVPSVFEGYDPVILDALAAGLPVIATPHTAAPDLIDDGAEGFIVPVRSPEEIAAKLELLHREPELRAEMSMRARWCAQRHTWENYERALAASVATALLRY